MKITLNTDRHPLFSIGKKFLLTEENPSVEIDISTLNELEKTQIRFNFARKVIFCEGIEELQLTQVVSTKKESISISNPVNRIVEERKIKETEELKSLLGKTLNTLKRELIDLSPRKIKLLLKMEKENKKRPKFLSLLEDISKKYEDSVSSLITEDATNYPVDKKDLFKGLKRLELDNISDVIESDSKEVTVETDKIDT